MQPSRRAFSTMLAAVAALLWGRRAVALDERERAFIEAAFRMKAEAERAGDQSYGAVVVRGGEIVGWGPSRVVAKRDATAHAEREAIRDAQQKLGSDLSDCVLYSSSRPCRDCERAAAAANIAAMRYGPDATDAGRPRSF